MKSKILALAAAAAISVGAAGLATSASAATPVTALSTAAQTTDGNLQNVSHFGYPGYGYGHRRRCRRLYRLGFVYGNPWARRAWYRNCRYRYYHGPRYRRHRFGIYFGF